MRHLEHVYIRHRPRLLRHLQIAGEQCRGLAIVNAQERGNGVGVAADVDVLRRVEHGGGDIFRKRNHVARRERHHFRAQRFRPLQTIYHVFVGFHGIPTRGDINGFGHVFIQQRDQSSGMVGVRMREEHGPGRETEVRKVIAYGAPLKADIHQIGVALGQYHRRVRLSRVEEGDLQPLRPGQQRRHAGQ